MPNVRVLNVDALAGKNRLNPEVLDNVRSGLAVAPDRRLKLVANLPYNVATPIIGNLLVHPEFRPERIVATIQLELAQRMMAEPDSDDYGALSVLIRALTDFTLVRTLRRASSGPGPRSTRPSSPWSRTRPSGRRSATSRGSTRSSAGSSSTAARTSGGSSTASGETAGPRPRSTPCSTASASPARSAPRP